MAYPEDIIKGEQQKKKILAFSADSTEKQGTGSPASDSNLNTATGKQERQNGSGSSVSNPMVAGQSESHSRTDLPVSPYDLVTEDEWKLLEGTGITKERMENLRETGSFLDLYNQIYKKPEPVDERKLANAHLFASIGESVKMLGDLYAAGRGAHVRVRDGRDSITAKTAARERELRELYQKRIDKHNEGWYNAALTDLQAGLKRHDQMNKAMWEALSERRKAAIEANRLYETRKYNDERIRQNEDRKNAYLREVESRIAKNKTSLREAESRIEKNKASLSNKDHKTIFVEANPKDSNSVKNRFGKRFREYNLSKDEYESLLAEAKIKALSDPDWADKHGVLIEKPKTTGVGIERKTTGAYKFNDRALVETYVKELYDAQFPAESDNRMRWVFAQGTESVLKNPNLPVDKKIEWLKSNEKISGSDIMDVFNERGLLLDYIKGGLSTDIPDSSDRKLKSEKSAKSVKEEELSIKGNW